MPRAEVRGAYALSDWCKNLEEQQVLLTDEPFPSPCLLLVYMYVYMPISMSLHHVCPCACRGRRKVSDLLELEMQVVVSCLIWLLVTEPGSSVSTASTLATEPSLQALIRVL